MAAGPARSARAHGVGRHTRATLALVAGVCLRSRWGLTPAALLCALGLAAPLRAEILPGMPDAIVCSVRDPTGMLRWERLVYYASARMIDGRTLYKTLTSDPVVLLVSPEGIIDGANLADCDGRNVKTLVEEGRAFVLTGPRPAPGDGRDTNR